MPTNPLRLTALMAGALPGPTDPQWERKMLAVITRGHLAAWMAGTGERLKIPVDSPLLSQQRLSRAERAEIKRIVERQLEYLRGFERAKGGMSEAQIGARSDLYPGALKQTYLSARWGDWEIPDHLMPGNQKCLTRCVCMAHVKDNGDGTGVWVRTMGGTEHHCTECPPLAGDHAVKRRGA